MPVTVYILVRAKPGKAADVAEKARNIKGVKSSHAVTGRYDAIITAEVQDLSSVGKFVLSEIQGIDGVERTETAIVV